MHPLVLPIYRMHDDLPYPAYAMEGSSGIDLRAALDEEYIFHPGTRFLVPTGLKIALLPNHEAQIRPRSGLAYSDGITVLNAPGTIDAAYRGEIKVLLIHLGQKAITMVRGMRIAQLVFAPVIHVVLKPVDCVDDLGHSLRQENGFGSTGLV